MNKIISGIFSTRQDVELTVEHLVQEYEIERKDIFIKPNSNENSVGIRASGGDVESGQSPSHAASAAALNGALMVSVVIKENETEAVKKTFGDIDWTSFYESSSRDNERFPNVLVARKSTTTEQTATWNWSDFAEVAIACRFPPRFDPGFPLRTDLAWWWFEGRAFVKFRAFSFAGLAALAFRRFRDWVKADVFKRLLEAVSDDPDMEFATIVKVHRQGKAQKGTSRQP